CRFWEERKAGVSHSSQLGQTIADENECSDEQKMADARRDDDCLGAPSHGLDDAAFAANSGESCCRGWRAGTFVLVRQVLARVGLCRACHFCLVFAGLSGIATLDHCRACNPWRLDRVPPTVCPSRRVLARRWLGFTGNRYWGDSHMETMVSGIVTGRQRPKREPEWGRRRGCQRRACGRTSAEPGEARARQRGRECSPLEKGLG